MGASVTGPAAGLPAHEDPVVLLAAPVVTVEVIVAPPVVEVTVAPPVVEVTVAPPVVLVPVVLTVFTVLFTVVVFVGAPEVDLTATGPVASDPGFQQDLAEEEQKVSDDLEPFKYYPIVSLGLTYQF